MPSECSWERDCGESWNEGEEDGEVGEEGECCCCCCGGGGCCICVVLGGGVARSDEESVMMTCGSDIVAVTVSAMVAMVGKEVGSRTLSAKCRSCSLLTVVSGRGGTKKSHTAFVLPPALQK